MSTATINVQYVNPPQAGKKQGNVKTDTGEYYGVPISMLAMFSPGNTYEVSYDSRVFNNKTYHTIKTVNLVGAAPRPASGGGKYGAQDSETSERIFVCGALNAFIQAGRIDPNKDAVKTAVLALRGAWSETFGSKTTPAVTQGAHKNDMDDEIPF